MATKISEADIAALKAAGAVLDGKTQYAVVVQPDSTDVKIAVGDTLVKVGEGDNYKSAPSVVAIKEDGELIEMKAPKSTASGRTCFSIDLPRM